MKTNNLYWAVGLLTIAIAVAIGFKQKPTPPTADNPPASFQPTPETKPEAPKTPRAPVVTTKIPPYLDYPQVVTQLQQWQQEAPDFAEVGTYGKTKQGKEIYYIRICNKVNIKNRPRVMITGCIHGNEPWAASCVMGFAGKLLGDYGSDPAIAELVNSRDIYIIPVISPDSYPHSRHVDGVDPNRDFPGPNRPNHKSTPSIVAVQDFYNVIRPNAVISGHTFGRVYLTPFGDKNEKCPNEADYQRVVGKMCQLSQYRMDRACNNYGRPIFGTEVDWYYRNGAFAIVMEFGTHQQKPSQQEINSEFNRTWGAVQLFIKEAPIVQIKSNTEDFDFSGNTGIAGRYVPLPGDEK